MRRVLLLLLCLSPIALGGVFAAGQVHAQRTADVADGQAELSAARARAAEARKRADALLEEASAAQNDAERTAADFAGAMRGFFARAA